MFEKIQKLRELFNKFGIHGYVIPSNDEFQNEYVPKQYRRLEYITNFTGSNGIAVITKTSAAFFTDGRYLLQAQKQLATIVDPKTKAPLFQIFDLKDGISTPWFKEIKEKEIIALDPMLHSEATIGNFSKVSELYSFKLKFIEQNLIDLLWQDKPIPAKKQAFILPTEYTGLTSAEKIQLVLKKLNKNVDYLLLTNIDSISWLLNIRGFDIDYTPFLLSYLLLSKTGEVTLFCDETKVKHLGLEAKIVSIGYFKNHLKQLAEQEIKFQVDPAKAPIWVSQTYKPANLVKLPDPVEYIKACKNKTEIEGFYKCHLEDGIAVTKFLAWLFENAGKVDELSAAVTLLALRQARKLFQFPSFATISAYGSNAAIVHYQPTRDTNKVIATDNLYLIDSGGQYLNGTTDITRTVFLGEQVVKEHQKYFTLVLKGHIAIATAKFPKGTKGGQLDALARVNLWQKGKDYAHGTGHGVGHFLSVHEGPQRISNQHGGVALEEGMVISNEPGFYEANNFGIRIENLVLVKASKLPGFLEFETLTIAPIQTSLVDMSMLTKQEKKWLKNYNDQVIATLKPHLSESENAFLVKHCQ